MRLHLREHAPVFERLCGVCAFLQQGHGDCLMKRYSDLSGCGWQCGSPRKNSALEDVLNTMGWLQHANAALWRSTHLAIPPGISQSLVYWNYGGLTSSLKWSENFGSKVTELEVLGFAAVLIW